MKSLKRTLSLVLVLVMVLGLFGVAGAAYKDIDKVQYKEAVEVMTGIGAIEGDNNVFDPAGNLTRAAAAKMVAYTVLGADIAKTLPVKTSSFKDVNANFAWAIPSIEYLVSKKVIEGYGDGNFGPNDKVTGNQLAKMLLVALDVKGDFSSASWELNTAIAARKAGIFKDSKATDFSAAATREEAALYCFNAINYSAAGTTVKYVVMNGATVVSTWDSFFEAYLVSQTNEAYTIVTEKKSVGSLADTLYKLVNTVATDDFGRPGARTWKYKNTVISQELTSTPILTYKAAVTGKALKLALANINYKLPAQLEVVRNGGTVNKYDTADAGVDAASFGGNGTLIEFYGDGNGNVTKAVVVVTYVGTVKTITKDDATTTTVDESSLVVEVAGLKALGGSGYPKSDITISSKVPGFAAAYAFANAAKASGIAAPLLVTPNGDNSASTKALTVLVPKYEVLTATTYVAPTGASTGYVTGGSFAVGTTEYKYSDTALAKLGAGGVAYSFTPFTAVYDAYGYVIATTGVETAANYAVVLAAGNTDNGLNGYTYNVQLLKADGKIEVVKQTKHATNNTGKITTAGTIVTYTVNATTGVYDLTDVASTDYSAKTIALKSGVSKFTWNGAPYYANAKTLFFVQTGTATAPVFKVYTGIANVPSMSGSSDGQVIADDSSFAKVVFVKGATEGTTAAGTVYLTGAYSTVVSADGTYHVANAIVNGEVKTVKLASTPVAGLYAGITYTTTGIGTVIDMSSPAKTATGTVAAANGVIGFTSGTNAGYYTYASDCAVFYISAVGAGSVSSINDITTDANDTVVFTVNAAGAVNAIYVQVVA